MEHVDTEPVAVRDLSADLSTVRRQVHFLQVGVVLLGGLSCLLTVVVGWGVIPHPTYFPVIRTHQIEVVAPDQKTPGVTISSGPNGSGAIVVREGRLSKPSVVIGSNQDSAGVVTLLVPNKEEENEPHVQLSASGGVLQSTGKTMAWRINSDSQGGGMIFADAQGLVFARLQVAANGAPELVLTDSKGQSASLRP